MRTLLIHLTRLPLTHHQHYKTSKKLIEKKGMSNDIHKKHIRTNFENKLEQLQKLDNINIKMIQISINTRLLGQVLVIYYWCVKEVEYTYVVFRWIWEKWFEDLYVG